MFADSNLNCFSLCPHLPGAPQKPASMPSKPPDALKLFKEQAGDSAWMTTDVWTKTTTVTKKQELSHYTEPARVQLKQTPLAKRGRKTDPNNTLLVCMQYYQTCSYCSHYVIQEPDKYLGTSTFHKPGQSLPKGRCWQEVGGDR